MKRGPKNRWNSQIRGFFSFEKIVLCVFNCDTGCVQNVKDEIKENASFSISWAILKKENTKNETHARTHSSTQAKRKKMILIFCIPEICLLFFVGEKLFLCFLVQLFWQNCSV